MTRMPASALEAMSSHSELCRARSFDGTFSRSLRVVSTAASKSSVIASTVTRGDAGSSGSGLSQPASSA
jgi:hypothetical protein